MAMVSSGRLMLDLVGLELSQEEAELLQHPLVAGVILFTRNYHSPEQITYLCHCIRQARKTPLLIAVDQEGGRIQRFRQGFTRLPSVRQLGKIYDEHPAIAVELSKACAWIMAVELLTVGIDFSFAPVLDIDRGANPAIRDRAFHCEPQVIAMLAGAFITGMHQVGMAATGKHFPGHGGVLEDTHVAIPVDERSFNEVSNADLQPFVSLINSGIDAIMPAHICFNQIDKHPVGFSRYWLQDVLRSQLKFTGSIISDDLNMTGASVVGNCPARVSTALAAGCDMAVLCNNRKGVIEVLDELSNFTDHHRLPLTAMAAKKIPDVEAFRQQGLALLQQHEVVEVT